MQSGTIRTGMLMLWAVLAAACSTKPSYTPEREYLDMEQAILTQFITVEDSGVIELPEGHFLFSQSLIMDGKKHVTVRGKGMDKTILSFKGQKQGAEGIKIANGVNITLEDFAVEDADGDNIKVSDTDSITFRRVKVAWTGEVSTENGAYGFYPVICKNVLIEECVAIGASDAGIYVGQSENVVIRNNKAYHNVAGIESENSGNVEIYGNEAYENTGGLLVFDLPGLTRYGHDIKVYDNDIHDNNLENFGIKGSIVSTIPLGSGVVILATSRVEMYNNRVAHHKTAGTAIISYGILDALADKQTEEMPEDARIGGVRGLDSNYKADKNYNPYAGQIFIHDNTFENEYILPSFSSDFGYLWALKNGLTIPDVVWDGLLPEDGRDENGQVKEQYKVCVQNDKNVNFVMLDAGNDFENFTDDVTNYACNLSI
ncbi:parallel beta-helix domain-containing protein [Algivirga pacifica]|uniref:Right handed beta helix domain-containing protein n=1 Tax=Algivirga pacifica TaxID=1162670 RepID=A0ABP9DG79_9BACT